MNVTPNFLLYLTRLGVDRVKPWNLLSNNLEWCGVEWSCYSCYSYFLWTLDLGFGTWIWNWDLGLDLNLTIIKRIFNLLQ